MTRRERVMLGVIVVLGAIVLFGGGLLLGAFLQRPTEGETRSGETVNTVVEELAPGDHGDVAPLPSGAGSAAQIGSGVSSPDAAEVADDGTSGEGGGDAESPRAPSSEDRGGGVVVTYASGAAGTSGRASTPTRTQTPPKPTATPKPNQDDDDTPTPTPTLTPTNTPTDTPTPTETLDPAVPPTETPESTEPPEDPIERINYYRSRAGVPPVVDDPDMNYGALKHAEYMAANRGVYDFEDPSNDYYTPEGSQAARLSNLWYGAGVGFWTPAEPIDNWMKSPVHRLWLIYPKAERIGFAFVEDSANGATAAVGQVFGGWNSSLPFDEPLKYPASGQNDVPAERFGVSLQFPVYTANPTFTSVTWVSEDDAAVGFNQIDPSNTEYMRNYGNALFLMPVDALAAWTTFTVHVKGSYGGEPFDIEWSFTTGG
jgi:uncharacterized protein YkwD